MVTPGLWRASPPWVHERFAARLAGGRDSRTGAASVRRGFRDDADGGVAGG